MQTEFFQLFHGNAVCVVGCVGNISHTERQRSPGWYNAFALRDDVRAAAAWKARVATTARRSHMIAAS
jgi:hypothetical protein